MRRFAVSLVCAVALTGTAWAGEGMWTFDNFPTQMVNDSLGTTIDQAWLDHVRGSAARLSTGCSSSVVSAQGLVLTNHHCIRDCAQQLSTAAKDYVKNGYGTDGRTEERLCPGMQAEILTTIDDVTGKVLDGAKGKSGQEFVKARDAAIAGIEGEACTGKQATNRCQVISFYQGGQYKLYIYKKFTDVRLVFAPEEKMAFFGGDPDNFNFPRYDFDCSFVRLYEQGKPAATPTHLTWNPNAPSAGAPVFVAGNPGTTQRLLTSDQLELLRDMILPDVLTTFAEVRGRLIRFSEESAEHARIGEEQLFRVENSFKALRGEEQALLEPEFLRAKRRDEETLQAKVQADKGLAGDIGNPWAEIARVQTERAALITPFFWQEGRAGYGSALYGYAVDLVRAAAERAKPNSERLREYTDARLPLVEKTLLDAKPVYPELEQLLLTFWLSKLRENLTADAPQVATYLGKDSPEMLGGQLAKSGLGDPALRKRLYEGGAAAIAASTDPLIQYVVKTDPSARAIRAQYEQRVTAPTDRAAERIARAKFKVYGTSTYPDATFSLRLSYGKVEGWTFHGQTVAPFTMLSGLYKRATGSYPFELAQSWVTADKSLNSETVFNIASSNDIIGGNSGSPLIDAKGQVIGAIFDGNIQSLGGAFAYDGSVNRAVAVSTAAITEGLETVYHARSLVAELSGTAPS